MAGPVVPTVPFLASQLVSGMERVEKRKDLGTSQTRLAPCAAANLLDPLSDK